MRLELNQKGSVVVEADSREDMEWLLDKALHLGYLEDDNYGKPDDYLPYGRTYWKAFKGHNKPDGDLAVRMIFLAHHIKEKNNPLIKNEVSLLDAAPDEKFVRCYNWIKNNYPKIPIDNLREIAAHRLGDHFDRPLPEASEFRVIEWVKNREPKVSVPLNVLDMSSSGKNLLERIAHCIIKTEYRGQLTREEQIEMIPEYIEIEMEEYITETIELFEIYKKIKEAKKCQT